MIRDIEAKKQNCFEEWDRKRDSSSRRKISMRTINVDITLLSEKLFDNFLDTESSYFECEIEVISLNMFSIPRTMTIKGRIWKGIWDMLKSLNKYEVIVVADKMERRISTTKAIRRPVLDLTEWTLDREMRK
ncbi:uncharacterized protein ASCRUDRAFT_78932 [Ascoidea rubescens DSM 1968]|uniref:Uncharacterized protein n=1 Tax=Ascoidea rubescens DSM 1968 TaxID=1344418 RepID=A0A1D2VQV7_9ASCO|nr:hypothetical protein ASCRUDRAFT_78932 [Ascoidea rubescens DSM 1968]ODV63968.1 hypothetical protein ASCRUDRAFT_78932 [Ascoidea rubescens DSM 1968]